jgi:hypothetical protein
MGLPRETGRHTLPAVMQPIVNLEEQPGKVVGRRLPASRLSVRGAQQIADSRAWQRTLGGIRVRRGVYRFRTHDEADAWLWEKLTRRHG